MSKLRNVYMDEAGSSDGGGGQGRDYAAEASRAGWQPKDKWSGAPEKWVDAKTFIERGEHILPIVLEQKKELERKLAETNRQLKEVQTAAVEFRAFTKDALNAQFNTRLEAALREKIAAIDAQDGAGVVASEQKIKKIETEHAAATEKAAATVVQQQDQPDPDYVQWLASNPWYADEGSELQMEANIIFASKLRKAKADGKEPPKGLALFTEVEKEVKKRHPDKFQSEQSSQRGSAVETGDTEVRRPSGMKEHTYNNLPQDARLACDKFIKNGMIPDKNYKTGDKYTIDQRRQLYCDDYQWD